LGKNHNLNLPRRIGLTNYHGNLPQNRASLRRKSTLPRTVIARTPAHRAWQACHARMPAHRPRFSGAHLSFFAIIWRSR